MKKTDLIQYIATLERKLSAARALLEVMDEDAIESNGEKPHVRRTRAAGQSPKKTDDYGANVKAVMDAAPDHPAVFDLNDLMPKMDGVMTRETLSQTLSALGRRKKLAITIPGVGRRPAKYQKLPS